MARSPKAQAAQSGRAYQVLPVSDLTGGLDLRTAQTLLPSERARTLTNWSLEQPGALIVRPGFRAFSTTSLGTGRIQGAQRVYLNTAIPSVASTAFTVVGHHGGLYLQTDSGGWANGGAAVYSTLSTGTEMHFPHDRNLVAVFDSVNAPRKSTNGTTWTLFGIARPSSGPVLSSGNAGSLSSAEFEIGYTYKDRDLAHESNGVVAVSTISVLNGTGSISVVVPNSTDAQVDAIKVYARNKTALESVRRYASSQAQSAGTHSTIVITSSNWTSNDEEPTDHSVPPVLSFGVVWKNRWWARSATVKNRLHFTQLFQPQSWPALFFIDIPFERGDEIRAIQPLGDTLMIFGTTKIFVIVGQTSLDFEVRPTPDSQGGAFGQRAVTVVENGVIHADAVGVLIFDGASDRLLSQELDPGWRDLVTNGSLSDIQKIAVAYDAQRKEIRIAVPRKYPSGTWGEWVLDLNRTKQAEGGSAWTETDRQIGGFVHWNGPEASDGNRGRLFSWHSSVARVFEEAVGTTANSSNMVAEYEGPGLTLGNRRARWTDVSVEYEPHSGQAAFEAVIDGVSQGSQSLNIGAGQAVYDTDLYDTATYAGAGRRHAFLQLPLSAEGRSFVGKVIYRGMEAFKVFTYTPGMVPETTTRRFSE
jgi:hypothetical protein